MISNITQKLVKIIFTVCEHLPKEKAENLLRCAKSDFKFPRPLLLTGFPAGCSFWLLKKGSLEEQPSAASCTWAPKQCVHAAAVGSQETYSNALKRRCQSFLVCFVYTLIGCMLRSASHKRQTPQMMSQKHSLLTASAAFYSKLQYRCALLFWLPSKSTICQKTQ